MTPAVYSKHGNRIYPALKDKQAQADVIRLFTTIDGQLPFKSKYAWVQSHTDGKNARRRPLLAIERDNNRVDALAKAALVEGIMSRNFISNLFPFKTLCVMTGNQKLTGPIRPFILAHHGRRVAKKVFGFGVRGKKLVNEEDFDYVYWDVFPKALQKFPSTFRDWLSKHVTGCCGVNRFLSKWKQGVINKCPSCKGFNEDIRHITTCLDPGRTLLFNEMVDELADWLEANHTPDELVRYFSTYLKARGRRQMQDIVLRRSRFHAMALMHDRLGWRSFLEGRISTVLLQEMHVHLSTTPSLIGAADWAKGLVNFLIRITHRQWKYRNDTTHFRTEGRTSDQHREIIDEMKRLMEVDPTTLLPKYRHLFEDEDFAELGRGSATNRIFWISAAKSAIAASAIHRNRRNKRRRALLQLREEQEASDSPEELISPYSSPQLPIEPGIKYKKRRLK